MSANSKRDESNAERLWEIRQHVDRAHREVQAAQRLAYADWSNRPPLRVRLALGNAQQALIKLLVDRLPS